MTIRQSESHGKLLAGLAVTFAIFHGSAASLGSDRGEAGLVVGLLVVGATLLFERWFFRSSLAGACRALGLGLPTPRGLVASLGVSTALLCLIPAFARATESSVALHPGWAALIAGLFAQAGVAEEVLFRGYLFAHLRRRHAFWRAAALSMIPFVAVHLLLFASLPWLIALTALVLAVVISFPLAYLFELGGGTIWPPALLHFVVQGAIKLVVLWGPSSEVFPLVWMVGCAVIPYLVFVVRLPASAHKGGD